VEKQAGRTFLGRFSCGLGMNEVVHGLIDGWFGFGFFDLK
jgi:hypothetical protein